MSLSKSPALALTLCLLLLGFVGCGDPARRAFGEAAQADQGQRQLEAATKYMDVARANAATRYGKLAKARAEVLLLEIGAQHLQAKQWAELDQAASKLLELDGSSMAGNLYTSYAAQGQGRLADASTALDKASGTARGVAPPTAEAIEATTEALYGGAEAGARSSLEGSVVDAQFLKNARARLTNKLARERLSAERRAELSGKGTLDAMATLLDNYADSTEAAKARPIYATKMAAKLESVQKVGPPSVQDPDPIATVVDALARRAPNEAATKKALASVGALRGQWEAEHEEQLKGIDEQVAAHQDRAMDRIAAVIRDKCAPLRERLTKGRTEALGPLSAAREEAAKLVPNGLTEEELQGVSKTILAVCTPPRQD